MQILSLCSGTGMLDEGVRLAYPQARTACMVEREGYLAALLVRRMQEGNLDEAPIWSDVKSFDGKPWRRKVDLVIGGYPCQPFSQIGKRGGTADPRHIWPDIARIIRECEPRGCFFENVANHLSLGFEQVHDELCSMGFEVASGVFSAEEVGTGQPRDRLFILALSRGERLERDGQTWAEKGAAGRSRGTTVDLADNLFPPAMEDVLGWINILPERPDLAPNLTDQQWSVIGEKEAQSELCGMVDGSSHRLERLRATGNGVVPLAVAYAITTLHATLRPEGKHEEARLTEDLSE
jgi:DNA (cytosine-5)-methyltransferase 1